MALDVYTAQPDKLLEAIWQEIAEERILAWICDEDGDFTHARKQWQNRAWLQPEVLNDRLRFTILAPTDLAISIEIYAVYHGRFTEMLLAHFDDQIDRVTASALPEPGDEVGK